MNQTQRNERILAEARADIEARKVFPAKTMAVIRELREENGKLYRKIEAERRKQMKMLRSHNLTLRHIGEYYGLSHERVRQIILERKREKKLSITKKSN